MEVDVVSAGRAAAAGRESSLAPAVAPLRVSLQPKKISSRIAAPAITHSLVRRGSCSTGFTIRCLMSGACVTEAGLTGLSVAGEDTGVFVSTVF